MNLYRLYQYNIWHLINSFKCQYKWLNINQEQFYNGFKNISYKDFSLIQEDPWLQKYSNNQYKLGENILKIGTFTPFIYQEYDNKKYIMLGRHRIYSLKQNLNQNREFLFIKIPHLNENFQYNNIKLWKFSNYSPPYQIKIKNNEELLILLIQSGDALSQYVWKNKNIPFDIFNNKNKFNKWINSPLGEINYDI